MERPYILHMFTPGRQMSPFDINMAADAGYQIIVPYCEVGLDGIGALAVGNVKYQTQHRLLVRMQQAEKAVVLSFAEAFAVAREVLAEEATKAAAKPA